MNRLKNKAMDNKHIEQIGETLVESKLLEAGILLAKPFFDHHGADLIGFTAIDDRGLFCRIQCKYRTLRRTTSVAVDASYVVGAFILFVCVQMDNEKRLYCFTPEEVVRGFKSSMVRSRSFFRLTITRKSASALSDYDYLQHPQERKAAILNLIMVASPNCELQRVFSRLLSQIQELSKLQRRRDDLRERVHKIEIIELEQKACDDQLTVLKEYKEVLEKQRAGQHGKRQ